jgi:hypothetical protein
MLFIPSLRGRIDWIFGALEALGIELMEKAAEFESDRSLADSTSRDGR